MLVNYCVMPLLNSEPGAPQEVLCQATVRRLAESPVTLVKVSSYYCYVCVCVCVCVCTYADVC